MFFNDLLTQSSQQSKANLRDFFRVREIEDLHLRKGEERRNHLEDRLGRFEAIKGERRLQGSTTTILQHRLQQRFNRPPITKRILNPFIYLLILVLLGLFILGFGIHLCCAISIQRLPIDFHCKTFVDTLGL